MGPAQSSSSDPAEHEEIECLELDQEWNLDTSSKTCLPTQRFQLHGIGVELLNARGFEVDFLRRQPIENDPHLFRFSDDEGDLWPVQAVRASVLTTAPRLAHAVISVNGRMALMRTIAPSAFVEFKRWMAEKALHREAAKRRRDRLQADIVQELLDQKLLVD